MEESNLNLNESGKLDNLSLDKEVSDDIISSNNGENDIFGGTETLLNIINDEPIEVVERQKFSFSSLFSKKDNSSKKESTEMKVDSISKDNYDEKENIIVGLNDNSAPNSNVNIFQELGDLNFLDNQSEIDFKIQSEPIVLVSQVTTYFFYLFLIFNILFFLHIYIKSTDSDFVSYIPGACSYIGSNIEGYDNRTDCKTFPRIISDLESNKNNLEKNIVNNLKTLIPSKLQIDYILATPEVKFILDKKSKSNVLYTKILSEFELIRTNATGGYKGKNIICSNYSFDEKGFLHMTCDFLGAPILDEGQTGDVTSRTVAIEFLKQLQLKNGNFQVMNYPKSIEITPYSSVDGLLTIFKTKSTLNLSLKYNLSSK